MSSDPPEKFPATPPESNALVEVHVPTESSGSQDLKPKATPANLAQMSSSSSGTPNSEKYMTMSPSSPPPPPPRVAARKYSVTSAGSSQGGGGGGGGRGAGIKSPHSPFTKSRTRSSGGFSHSLGGSGALGASDVLSNKSGRSIRGANISTITPVVLQITPPARSHSPGQSTHQSGTTHSHESGKAIDEEVPDMDLKEKNDADEWFDKDVGGACIGYIYDLIFLRTLSHNDLFTDIMRKLMITAGFLYSPCSLAFGAYWLSLIWTDPSDDQVAARVIAATSAIVVALFVFVPAYAYIRMFQEATDWLLNYWIAGIAVCFFGIGIACPAFPVPTAMYALAEASVLARSNLLIVQLTLAFGVWLVMSYNVSTYFVAMGAWNMAALTHVHVGTSAENVILTFVGFFILFLMTGALWLQYIEFVKLVDRSASTSQMSKEVASKLRAWDMAGIKQALKQYNELPHAETKIYNEFCGIVGTINEFARYVPKEVVVSMISQDRISGSSKVCQMENKILTLFFMDIAGFTTMCETMDLDTLVALTSEYFAHATKVLMLHSGVIDKFIGDAIFAIFGAPAPCEHQGVMSISAALHLLGVVRHVLRPMFEEEGFGLDVRIGAHRGPAVVGTIGSKLRVSFTALGNSVNLASRLEGLNKHFRTNIAVSQDLLEDALVNNEPVFATRRLGPVTVKGKTEATIVHQVVGVLQPADTAGRRRRMSDSLTSTGTAKFADSGAGAGSGGGGATATAPGESPGSGHSGGQRSSGGQQSGSTAGHDSGVIGGMTQSENNIILSTTDSSDLYTESRAYSVHAAILHAANYFQVGSLAATILEDLDKAHMFYEEGVFVEAKTIYTRLMTEYTFPAREEFGGTGSVGNIMSEDSDIEPHLTGATAKPPQDRIGTTGLIWPSLLLDSAIDYEMLTERVQHIDKVSTQPAGTFSATHSMDAK